MEFIIRYICIFIFLSGCTIKTPQLPSFETKTFSYDEMMDKKNQIEQEAIELCNNN